MRDLGSCLALQEPFRFVSLHREEEWWGGMALQVFGCVAIVVTAAAGSELL